MPQPPDLVAMRLIRTKAHRLCGRHGFSASDRSDVEQELWLHMHLQAPRFDPSMATWECFISYVLDKRCISLLRHRCADKRSPGREAGTLNDAVLDQDGNAVERHETTPETAHDSWPRHDMESDIASVLADLPEPHRAIAIGLAFGTVNSVGEELGISRRSMAKHVAELRAIFEDAGLREYL